MSFFLTPRRAGAKRTGVGGDGGSAGACPDALTPHRRLPLPLERATVAKTSAGRKYLVWPRPPKAWDWPNQTVGLGCPYRLET